MMKKIISILLVLLCVAMPADASGKKKKKEQPQTPPPPAKTQYETITAGCESAEGLFNLFLKDGKVLVEVPMSVMDKDLLIASVISGVTDNAFSNPGEMPRKPMQAFFRMENGKLALCRHRFDLESGDENISRSISINTMRTILQVFDVKAWSDDRSSVVVDMTEFFAGNNSELSPFAPSNPSGMQVREQFKRDLSYVSAIKSFSDNASVRSVLSYSVSATTAAKKPTRFADTPFTVEVTRTIMLLPEEQLPLREYDPRVGVFHFSKTSFANDNAWARNVSYAQRWRLQPGKPIVFYIDPNFPESWKPFVKKGVEVWQKAFDAIGIKDAIVARDYPQDDPEFDPDNLKYCCVRYSASTSVNAMGPMWYDPRTGEILSANVSINHNVIRLIQQWRFVQTAAADPRVRGEKIPENLFGESLAYVVSHEIGHSLGLMHNMAGSSGIPVEALRDPESTAGTGTTYSIMDYARYNYVAQPGDLERGVKLCPPSLGLYDMYAIEWLYSPEADGSAESEKAMKEWVDSHSGDLRYRYGIQQLQNVLDPSSIDEDLGDDPVAASRYGISNLKYIAEHIGEWCGPWDSDYSFRGVVTQEMLTQYQRYISACLYNVGGRYTNAHLSSDRWVASEPVPYARQKESVAFILTQAPDQEWLDLPQMKEGRARKDDLGPALSVSMVKALMQRFTQLPVSGEGAYTKSEFLSDMFKGTFAGTAKSASLSETEMSIQLQYVNFLIGGAGLEPTRAITDDNGSVHCCYSALMDCRKLLSAKAKTGDEATRNHYSLLLYKIDKSTSK